VIRLLTSLAVLAAMALGACGGDDDDSPAGQPPTAASGSCSPIEEVDVELGGQHSDAAFTAADYPTNPPTGGDHNPTALAAGSFYEEGAPLGQAVHLLEHGAVVGWTKDLSPANAKAVQDAFNDIFREGYYQVAVVENPELEVPFALSAWGAMQTCDEVDTSVIEPFVEQWYASPKSAESTLACQGSARQLPPC
jgi:hypothetical protein